MSVSRPSLTAQGLRHPPCETGGLFSTAGTIYYGSNKLWWSFTYSWNHLQPDLTNPGIFLRKAVAIYNGSHKLGWLFTYSWGHLQPDLTIPGSLLHKDGAIYNGCHEPWRTFTNCPSHLERI